MYSDILVIGSGFAAYQLIKSLRRMGNTASISVLCADDGHDYNKPDLSHAFSKQQDAEALITLTAKAFAEEHQIDLFTNHQVTAIDAHAKTLEANGQRFRYGNLVLATGASTFMPQISGDGTDELITLNSLAEYLQYSNRIAAASKVTLVGGGLIGVELALDMAKAGKVVTLIEPSARLMQNLLPDYIEMKLRQTLQQHGITVICGQFVSAVDHKGAEQQIVLNNGQQLTSHATVLATGLRANMSLAQQAGLTTNKGIVVDRFMRSSAKHIYAIGDCAEFNGEVRAYLQPIVISAMALAKTLSNQPTEVNLPQMMVKVKTPEYPIQLAGKTNDADVHHWHYQVDKDGIKAKAFDNNDALIGFVVSGSQVTQAFPLFREL
ncbi:NADH:flavorubredoxin reductase NorW [Shewanella sp. 1CM18E]|uniref:NADH:flavorubredoxin reductase NorW n=1 Tax=Shewanella sp. 1CM18E TaxID=2929169 RepID=UPI0020BDD429|nr:NADH:flavorubredoxin reductase NorW [Shewanella sp. 1CM18E]MCK8044370.1 NADH:flavorubredoxin reductase NorW [Shewanella sp. 1CM18E]